jgi:hypothetical protein
MLDASQEAAKSSPRWTQSMLSICGTPFSKVIGVINLLVISITNDGFIKANKENVGIESCF